MALTDYVTLGQSGLKVSPFCFGAMTFGNEWGFGSDEPTSKRILDEFCRDQRSFAVRRELHCLSRQCPDRRRP